MPVTWSNWQVKCPREHIPLVVLTMLLLKLSPDVNDLASRLSRSLGSNRAPAQATWRPARRAARRRAS